MLLAAAAVVGRDGQQARELALAARVGLQGDRRVAGELGEPALQVGDQLQRAGGVGLGGERVQVGERRPGDGLHLGGRVELHRARAQRDHRAVQREVGVGEAAQPAHQRGLRAVLVEHRVGQVVAGAGQRPGQGVSGGGVQGGGVGGDPERGPDRLQVRHGGQLRARDADGVGIHPPQRDAGGVGGVGHRLRTAGHPRLHGVEERVVDELHSPVAQTRIRFYSLDDRLLDFRSCFRVKGAGHHLQRYSATVLDQVNLALHGIKSLVISGGIRFS